MSTIENFGRLIFELEGRPQKTGWFKRTKSHLACYEKGLVINELGDRIEILKKDIPNVYYCAPQISEANCATINIENYQSDGLNTYPLDEKTWNGIFGLFDRILDNEWSEFRRSKTEQPDNVKWFNMVNAVMNLTNENDHELFGGDLKTSQVSVGNREMLSEFWGVKTKKDLMSRLEDLYDGASAWDFVRMIWIASCGYLADYLSYDEAIHSCTSAGRALQRLYNSFDEMFDDYMQGYIRWSGDDPEDEESEAWKRMEIYKWLKSLPRSPYCLNWYTKL